MRIDLNCDMAEGIGNEAELMPYISSANIACGFHAGDATQMASTVRLCKKHGVAVGAHPSFPDRENFGRKEMHLPADQVYALVLEQIQLLQAIAEKEGARVHHVKAHGALYNMTAKDRMLAQAVVRAAHQADPRLVVFGLAGSLMADVVAEAGMTMAHEVFADRTYQADGSLTPRSRPDALVTSVEESCKQVLAFVRGEAIMSTNGVPVRLKADTICLHGDGEHAIKFAHAIRQRLEAEKIMITHG